jgi:molybdopterin-containing oxidoreductase family iron-sulfur binding subunit
MDRSRRRFLLELGGTALGIGAAGPVLAGATRAAAQGTHAPVATSERQWAMVIDVDRCLSDEVRQACADACHREHNVPAIPDRRNEVKWIWSEPWEHTFPEQVHTHTAPALRTAPVLVMCNHCTDPSCVKVCPTGATWKRDSDGLVMMDMHRCIGCRYCMAACPYGSRSFNWRDPRDFVEKDAAGNPVSDYPTRTTGVVEKCSFCAERLRESRQPACVEAANQVPGGEGALTFGDVSDPDSEVSRLLREKHTLVRKVSLGTGPNVYYLVPSAVP